MLVIKNEIRPIGFITIEFNESEIQSLIGTTEELCMLKNNPEVMGIRANLYNKFKEILKTN